MTENVFTDLGRGGNPVKSAGTSGSSPNLPPAQRRQKPVNDCSVDTDAVGNSSATARLFIIKFRGSPVRIIPRHPLAVRRVYELVWPENEATAFPSETAAFEAARDCRMAWGNFTIEPFDPNQTKK